MMKSDLYKMLDKTWTSHGGWPQPPIIVKTYNPSPAELFLAACYGNNDDNPDSESAAKTFLDHLYCDDDDLEIVDVIFNAPATIVKWSDGDKTVVKCDKEDKFDERVGFLLCVLKKYYNNNIKFYSDLDKWIYHSKTKDKKTKAQQKKQNKKDDRKLSEKTERDDIKELLGLVF